MFHASARGLALCTAALSAAVLTACGSGVHDASTGAKRNGEASKTGPQVAKDAANALRAAGAVHVRGTTSLWNGKESATPATIEMQLQEGGGEVEWTSSAYSMHFIVIGKDSYFRYSNGLAGIPPALTKQLAGKWIKSAAPSGDSDNEDPSLAAFAQQLEKPASGGSFETMVTATTLNGRPAVLITGTKGDKIWVAATGTPYPVKLYVPQERAPDSAPNTGTSPSGPSTATLSGFGTRVSLRAPTNVIDESDLQKLFGNAPPTEPSAAPS